MDFFRFSQVQWLFFDGQNIINHSIKLIFYSKFFFWTWSNVLRFRVLWGWVVGFLCTLFLKNQWRGCVLEISCTVFEFRVLWGWKVGFFVYTFSRKSKEGLCPGVFWNLAVWNNYGDHVSIQKKNSLKFSKVQSTQQKKKRTKNKTKIPKQFQQKSVFITREKVQSLSKV